MVKETKSKWDYQRISGNDIMPFMWHDEQWEIIVKGFSTLAFHRPIAARVLIAMYECELEDIICTKDNVHDRYKLIAGRLGLKEPKSPTTVQRQFEVLEGFHIDGVHNPFVIRKKEKARHRQENPDVVGRGGESGMWGTLFSYPRMPIGAWLKDHDEFTRKALINTNNGFILRYEYRGEQVRDEIRR